MTNSSRVSICMRRVRISDGLVLYVVLPKPRFCMGIWLGSAGLMTVMWSFRCWGSIQTTTKLPKTSLEDTMWRSTKSNPNQPGISKNYGEYSIYRIYWEKRRWSWEITKAANSSTPIGDCNISWMSRNQWDLRPLLRTIAPRCSTLPICSNLTIENNTTFRFEYHSYITYINH